MQVITTKWFQAMGLEITAQTSLLLVIDGTDGQSEWKRLHKDEKYEAKPGQKVSIFRVCRIPAKDAVTGDKLLRSIKREPSIASIQF